MNPFDLQCKETEGTNSTPLAGVAVEKLQWLRGQCTLSHEVGCPFSVTGAYGSFEV